MKKLTLFVTLAMAALLFTSCSKNDYEKFVGIWGVEKIEYYNIDFAGNPIDASMDIHKFDPDDTNNGIHLVFRENKTGEMRDSAIDSLPTIQDGDTVYIHCSDTVMVYTFSYSYDKNESILYMNMDYGTYIKTFKMYIDNLTDDSFTYENEYDKNYVEKAYLKRISNTPSKSASRQKVTHPYRPGSFLGGR